MAERRPRLGQVSASEWRFVVVLGLLALAITSIPYVVGAALSTPERAFGGFVYAVDDGYSYLAKMRQGAEGSWLFHIVFTPEPHPGTLLFPFHLVLGKLAALLASSDLTAMMVCVYQAARLVFGFGLVLTLYRFLAAFTERVLVRRVGWLMTVFGGGLGWLLLVLGGREWLGSLPLDFILPEGYTFLVLYGFPHIALARSLLLWGLLFLLDAWQLFPRRYDEDEESPSRPQRAAAIAGILWLAMGLIVSFYVAVAWAVAGAMWLAKTIRERRVLWRSVGMTALAGLLSAPIVVYSAIVFSSDDVYATWFAQNLISSPHPLHYLAAFGVPLILAMPAVGDVWRDRERPTWALVAWVAAIPVLVYLPVNVQRRLVEGAQVALSLLAALGVCRLQAKGWKHRTVVNAVLSLVFITYALMVVGNSLQLLGQPAPVYRNQAELVALDWLGERVESDDVVLASYETGNYLPARVGARSFIGLGPEPVDFAGKEELVERCFDATADDSWRRDLLERYGVDFVFRGPFERQLGEYDPRQAPFLRLIYESAGYEVYEVEAIEP
ncbi:MAG: hypothetical protein E3J64_01465 [Anaerolineales bacterium]|nr:MAG: hypothetical protein E3J64_01465 [Anaerolineales bacterium]